MTSVLKSNSSFANKMTTQKKKKIGFTCGAFDLCHAGHILMFKDCKKVCDYLIIGLQSDPSTIADMGYRDKIKNAPVMTFEERLIILKGIKYIDEVITYGNEKDLYTMLKDLTYDIRILGSDWKGKKYTGWDLPHTPFFNNRDHGFSTTQLRTRIAKAEREKEMWLRKKSKSLLT